MTRPAIDWPLFGASAILIGGVCGAMALVPEQSSTLVAAVYDWIAGHMGLFYQWMTLGAFVVLVVIAFGKYGRRRLGGENARREYSNFSWMSMLFCAGIGAGLMYWSVIEWAYYLDTPPFGLDGESPEAREWAATYGIFHWGLSAWCVYCLPTVAIAYPYYQRKIPYLRLSTSLVGVCGDDVVNKPLGRVVDFVFVIALVGGTGTSLGLATPMISACISALFGIPGSLALNVVVVFVAVSLFALSVYLGLERGIKRLSNINAAGAGIFVLFVLLAGPTYFALKLGTNSLGLLIQDFVRLNTWTDPILETGFVEDWSVFYWAWWLAYGPYMGVFVTRISRGRTLRQLILGMVGFGTLGCAIFYICVGNTAMWMDMEGLVPVREFVAAGSADTAIALVIEALPLQPLPLIAFIVITFIFVATTYDSGSYAISAAATRHLAAGVNPHRWHRVFWAFSLAVLPVTLLFVGGGLRAVQSAVLVVSLPLLAIGVAMVVSLFKTLREQDQPEQRPPPSTQKREQ